MAQSHTDIIEMIEPPTAKVRMVLDTDTFNEIDDQFALVYALISPIQVDVEAIYAAPFFNKNSSGPADGMELSYQEVLRLLKLMNRPHEGFVFRGARDYVGPNKRAQPSDAVTDLIARARSASTKNPLYVVAIAAITNVASAILLAPDIIDKIVVVWLGGHALHWPDTAEFNLSQDIGAAQVVLDSGVPLVLIPCMGVTSHLHASAAEIERYVAPCGPLGDFLAKRFLDYNDDHMGWTKAIWDIAAVAWLIEPNMTLSTTMAAPVLNDPPTWSMDPHRHPLRMVYHVKRDAILKDFFEKLSIHSGV